MASVALVGAGGKMGMRITRNLLRSDYEVFPIENSAEGVERLNELGLRSLTTTATEISIADFVILAVPDRVIGIVAKELIPALKSGATLLVLDPAAVHAGEVPQVAGINLVVAHPCHPPLWSHETDPEARNDFFGGVKAKQAVVCALAFGDESSYAPSEALAKVMYGPVTRSHRITVEQMAVLEPAMAETVTAMCCAIIKESLDEAVKRGVPEEAALDFMMGHVNIPLAIVFGRAGNPFSDGAKLIMEYGKQRIIQPDWKQVFEPESILEQVRTIVDGKLP
jgi:D-apionate oxidoisomerase